MPKSLSPLFRVVKGRPRDLHSDGPYHCNVTGSITVCCVRYICDDNEIAVRSIDPSSLFELRQERPSYHELHASLCVAATQSQIRRYPDLPHHAQCRDFEFLIREDITKTQFIHALAMVRKRIGNGKPYGNLTKHAGPLIERKRCLVQNPPYRPSP